jgi:chromosome partitioning protein
MSQVLAIANIKGGVGKTTTTANLAAALAERGRQVLAVDLDPQASLTLALGAKTERPSKTIRDVLALSAGVLDSALMPIQEHLDLLPSNHGLRAAEHDLDDGHVRVFALRDALTPIRTRYDYILVDCPASVGILTGNALAAADQVIIPLPPDYLALESLDWLLHVIRETQAHLNPNLRVAGFLLAMYVPGAPFTHEIVAAAKRRYIMDIPFFASGIPFDECLKQAPLAGKSILRFAPESSSATAFRAFAEELEEWFKEPGSENAGNLACRGREQAANGDRAAAYRDFRRATELQPALAEAWIGRAQTAAENGETIRCWAKVIQLDPSCEAARNELSTLALNRITSAQASDIPELLMLGQYLVDVSQLLAAELFFRRVTRLDPNHAGAWLGLARAAETSQMALGYYERALRLDPENAQTLAELESEKARMRSQSSTLVATARALAHKGERGKAHELFLAATEIDPENDLAWLGSAHTTDVQRTALKFAEKALQVNPENEEAKNLHRWLWVPEHEPWELPIGWQTWASMAAALVILSVAIFVILQYLAQ